MDTAQRILLYLLHRARALIFPLIRSIQISPRTFPQLVREASWIIPYPKHHHDQHIRRMIERRFLPGTRLTYQHYDEIEHDTNVSRILANIVCLAAMAAAKLPQGLCSSFICIVADANMS